MKAAFAHVNVPSLVWTALRRTARARGVSTSEALRAACELYVRRSERYAEYVRMTGEGMLPAVAARAIAPSAPSVRHRDRGPFVVVRAVPRAVWGAFKAEAAARDVPLNTALTDAATRYAHESALFDQFCGFAADWPQARRKLSA